MQKELANNELLEVANKFLEEKNLTKKSFFAFAKNITEEGVHRHSDIWSRVYDFVHEVWKMKTIPEKIETALTEYIEVHFLHKKEESVWICVYKDTIRRHNDSDNLAHIRVLKSFAEQYYKEQTDSEWKTFDEFLNNYTADETDDFYTYANNHNAILEMDIDGKAKNYMLISVVSDTMHYAYFETLESAQAKMRNEVSNSCSDINEYIEREYADISEKSAWVFDGNNHNKYNWWIVDQRKSVYDLLCETENDYDTTDSVFDAIVTVCYIEETDKNDDYEKFCIELLKKVKVISIGKSYVEADWYTLICDNQKLLRQFMRENWSQSYSDEDDFIYEWIKEIHSYLAGYVSDKFYKKLVDLVKELK